MASRRSTAIALGIVGSVILLLGTFAAGLVVIDHNGGVIDEWQCADGERPIYTDQGGGDCLKPGKPVPAGFHVDPLGNRPLSCDGRWHWVEIKALKTTRLRPYQSNVDCIRDDTLIPRGWVASGR